MRVPSRIACEIDFDRDGKQHGFLRVPVSTNKAAYAFVPVPIVCIKGGNGATILLVAGNHGDEYEGQVALCKLVMAIEPADIKGRIIILPAANFPAALNGTRTSPLDDGNLNRAFPGDPDGGPTSMIAHYIESHLLPLCDGVVDLHSGGSTLQYVPCALATLRGADPKRYGELASALLAFGAPISYFSEGGEREDRMLSAAADRAGVIYTETELGGCGTVSRHALKMAEEGLRRMLAYYGILEWPNAASAPGGRIMRVISGKDYLYCPENGVFEPWVDLGDMVESGQTAGLLHFPDTPWREPVAVRFASSGFVICKRVPALSQRGHCLFHLAADLSEQELATLRASVTATYSVPVGGTRPS
ncbi:deacylase [Mesorhizobium sp. M8A.F.Ca.ET.173.01.1.1]|nr:deacylase [Mesorhizobium sp. M8A.F.Ca.ET.182.01.1.1]TGS78385.1 deacylase [Mesorhizobium sp. M8A.F.Ca.ET.181.01.1.1]TGV15555.1 deacylase [Mesorhizobium sp. M8A.F.Ca.ET.173.01.1.1]